MWSLASVLIFILVVSVVTDTRSADTNTVSSTVVTNNTTINKTLQEPLIIDRLSDIYLESFLTFHDNPQDGSTPGPGLDLNNDGGGTY